MNGKTILVADGNKTDVRTLARVLATEGYEVLEAGDGAETVSTVRQYHPDLVLLNTSFPPDVGHGGGAFCDGILVIDWVRRTDEGFPTRFILLTEEDSPALQARARTAGALGLFPKPLNLQALVEVIHRVLDPVAA